MRSTKKHNQWFFAMKTHIGVDGKTKLIHSVVATAANVHDSVVIGDLLYGEETRVWGDSASTGKTQEIAEHAPNALDFTNKKGTRNRQLTDVERDESDEVVCAGESEHAFGVVKLQFGFTIVRYKGLAKHAHHLFVSFVLTNLVFAKKTLLRSQAWRLQASSD